MMRRVEDGMSAWFCWCPRRCLSIHKTLSGKLCKISEMFHSAGRGSLRRTGTAPKIKVKRGQRPESVKNAMLNMMKWCRITAIDLLNADIQADRVKRHAAELGHCASLAHLNLFGNEIGAEGAGRLAAVLGQCASLAHLDLGFNEIGDEGRESCGSARALCITCSSESVRERDRS